MEWISNKLLRFILKKEVIKNDPDYIAFYKYGIEITVSSVISFLLVIRTSLNNVQKQRIIKKTEEKQL